MPEQNMSAFKKLFGGLGSRKKEAESTLPPEETAPQPDAAPPAPPKEEPDAFAVPAGNALAKVWSRCAHPGLPSLNPRFQSWSAGPDIPADTLKKSFYKVLRQASVLSQRWLDMENAGLQARAAAQAEAEKKAAQQADGEQPAEPAAPAGPEPPLDIDEMGEVLVAGDGMAAWLLLLPPSGNGKTLAVKDVETMLSAAKVVHGVSQPAVEAVLSDKVYFQLLPIARGTDPVPGTDGWIDEHFSRSYTRTADTESKVVDYRAQSNVQAIAKDAVICDIHLPVPGTPGKRVDGLPVAAPPVKAASVPAGSGTAVSPDGTKLLSLLDGFLEFRGGTFNVKDLLNIPNDVDYSTGNIDFRGDVNIRGDVREQFSVKATGDIVISGLVEAACVEAGGDLVISNGVSGNGQAVIRGKNVRVKYLENCTVYAENLESEYILTSCVYCSGSVTVTGGRGAIIGGQIVAAQNVKASCIGSQTGRTTKICMGVKPDVREEFAANKTELTAIRKEASELAKRATYLKKRMEDQGGRPDARSSREIENAVARITELAEREKALTAQQAELSRQLTSLPTSRLECNELYPGVRLTIGSAGRVIESMIGGCVAVFDPETRDIKFM